MPRPKPGWNVGKLNSPTFEWYDLMVFMPLQHSLRASDGSDRLLLSFREGRHFREKPLGSLFLKRLTLIPDPLTLVLTVHLFLERFLDGIIVKKYKHAPLILDNRGFTFALKTDLLRAKNYLSEDCHADIRLVNSIRNKYAHDLAFDLARFDMSQFWYCEQWPQLVLKSDGQRRDAATYVFRCVSESLLWRLTARHEYLADIEAPPALKLRHS